jgi:hypothetical protein
MSCRRLALETETSCPTVSIFTVNPFDFRKEAMYPREIGVVTGAKGFISINNTFTLVGSIGDPWVKVKGKQAHQWLLSSGNTCDFRVVMQ